jgi:hypothetical protein
MLYDKGNKLYMDALFRILCASGVRADERLSRAAAQKLLSAICPDIAEYIDEEDIGVVQEYNGGARLFSDSSPDVLLTAKALCATPDLIDTEAAKGYLQNILTNQESSASEVTAAYMGLASANEPVLLDIRRLLDEHGGRIELQDQLHLAIGLVLLGDVQGAKAWFNKNIAPFITDIGGWQKAVITGDPDEDYRLTAETAILANVAGIPNAGRLLDFVIHTDNDKYLPNLDLLCYLKNAPLPTSGESSCSYSLDGELVEVNFSETILHVVRMGKAQLAEAGFEGDAGINASIRYVGGIDNLRLDNSGKITVTKTYDPPTAQGTVKVTIDVKFDKNAPIDRYVVTDVLPSGLRYVKYEYVYGQNWFLIGEDGGRLNFVLDRTRWYYKSGNTRPAILYDFKIVYYARVAIPGNYVADSAVVQHIGSGLCTATAPYTITVGP